MTLWLLLLLIVFAVFAGLGVLQWKARALTCRRKESFEEQRNLATERLEQVLLQSSARENALTEAEYPAEGDPALKIS